jgi:hypothetical protein
MRDDEFNKLDSMLGVVTVVLVCGAAGLATMMAVVIVLRALL